MKKSKILFVTQYMLIGGIEKSLINLCQSLDPDKFDISVLILAVGKGISDELPDYVDKIFVNRNKTISFKKQYSKFWSKHYDRTVSRTFNNKYPVCLRLLLYKILCFEAAMYRRYIKSLFAQKEYDVCVGYLQGEASDIAVNCINSKKHFLFYHSGKISEFINDKAYYDKADRIIAVSQLVRENLISKKHLPKDKVLVMHNIYNQKSIIEKSTEKCELDDISTLKLLTVGRISSEKGILQAVKSGKQLKDLGFNFKWFFVGPDNNNHLETCLKFVKDNKLEQNIVFTGAKANPFPYIRSADIYIQPSEFEALPGTVAEAMILGKPIISTRTYGGLELLEDGTNGLICGFEPEEITAAIQKLLTDNDLRNKISQNAKYSSKNFDCEIEKYIDLFTCK